MVAPVPTIWIAHLVNARARQTFPGKVVNLVKKNIIRFDALLVRKRQFSIHYLSVYSLKNRWIQDTITRLLTPMEGTIVFKAL